jgi:hypothetical protein
MTKISVPVTVTIEVEFDFPDEYRSSIPGLHMEYAEINEEESPVGRILVSAMMPSVYWFDLRSAPEPFAEKYRQITPQVNFHPVLNHIVNEWDDIMRTAMRGFNEPEGYGEFPGETTNG